jgi:hypothetical protein
MSRLLAAIAKAKAKVDRAEVLKLADTLKRPNNIP